MTDLKPPSQAQREANDHYYAHQDAQPTVETRAPRIIYDPASSPPYSFRPGEPDEINSLPPPYLDHNHWYATPSGVERDPEFLRKFICAYIRHNLPVTFSDSHGNICSLEEILDGDVTDGSWVRNEETL